MGKELPIISSSAQPAAPEKTAPYIYSRVFCQKENSPPLGLLLDFLRSRGQVPLTPNLDQAALDDWAWVRVALSYDRERKPIQVFCARDRGSYKDVFDQERTLFLETLSVFDDIEANLVREHVTRARFILTTQMVASDITEEGHDFNGWILQFYQEQCTGIVQVDGQGFFSPSGQLVVDLAPPTED